MFKIVNVAGEEDSEDEKKFKSALEKLNDSIGEHPEQTYTITLSCGRLTTGVSVPAWTAVLMLSGSSSTSASSYLQTIFRVQTPANIDGKIKDKCYVFDFAPDRTLQMVAEAGKLGIRPGKRDKESEGKMREFLNFCPVIAIKGSEMRTYDVDTMLKQLKRFYAARVAKNGFDDVKLYNDELLKLTELDLKKFENLKKIVGESKASDIKRTIEINKSDLGSEELEDLEDLKKKSKKKGGKELSQEEKERLERLKKAREEKGKAISILRSISIRIPLLIYGSDRSFDEDITINSFADMIDDISWEEFMPKGITKAIFNDFIQYYDKDIFIEAGNQIRRKVKAADELPPTERIKKIAEIFNTFKNPDKETVLTPWRVVNLHLGETLGGYDFFKEKHDEMVDSPRFVDNGEITKETLSNVNAKILEINSKSGLYPLYVAYSLYRARLQKDEAEYKIEDLYKYWDEAVKENVFVVCKTPMAQSITKRTLIGYRNEKCNTHHFEDLINQFKNKSDNVVKKIKSPSYWGLKGIKEMEFDAVVGNPPYQIVNEGNGTGADPIYHLFIDVARDICGKGTFIHPARFLFNAGKTPKEWNAKILNDEHFRVVQYWPDSSDVFPTVDIKGGVVVTAWDVTKKSEKIGVFVTDDGVRPIMNKVLNSFFKSFSSIIYTRDLYRLSNRLYEENPWAEKRPSKGHKFDVGSNVFEIFPELFYNNPPNTKDYAMIIGVKKNLREKHWIKKTYLLLPDNFDYYKVFVAKANGSGSFGEALSSPIVGNPNEGSTATFLSVGRFSTKKEAENVVKYLRTKFARTMLSTLKVTQNSARDTWANVPLQDFTENSDIDWTKTISEIDKQLYKKYELTEEEINFIETKVQPME